MSELQKNVVQFLTQYGFQIVGAIIILTAGALIARWVGRVADQWFTKKEVEPPIKMLAVRVIRLLVFGMALVLALEKFGVPIAPMIAGIGVVGVGIGLAMQHVLSNLFAGLTIIFTKPFRVGEWIELLGESGQVKDVALFSTILLHTDRSRVVIPNRKIIGEILHNFGKIRQLDLSASASYDADFERVLWVVKDILNRNARVLKDPAPVIGVGQMGDSSVNIIIKPWVAVEDYIAAGGELNKAILEQFRAAGIDMPFPQREVRLLKDDDGANPPLGMGAGGSR
jgi:small conductance mechanosensitive channel